MKIIVSSVIISASVLLSAAMLSGNVDFKKQNILKNDNGHVSLGKVYSENAYVDVEFKIDSDSSTIFKLTDLSVGSYQDSIRREIQSIVDEYNKDKSDDKKTTIERLSLKVPATLTLKIHNVYRSENIPVYNLTINNESIKFDKETLIFKSVSDATDKFLKENNKEIMSTFFLTK
ncbi:TPA: hypothetical protein QHU55_004888 [Klebsiella aerogenes]|uniref:hypothetical protein n=1 Tax=Klebsiella aerogenes TaxID=548 RepID=UPI0027516F6B|nr:hypothetical protein [Klebsiella aerogenes]HDS6532773.1 hypothetical protein [Klebsiella aerogenes]HDS7502527.1 hypothetical protein [Klebsiella aerogenes]HDS9642488.1 hypothetical protein [Klebsiella aerogenes]HDT0788059.1 hypothetical protein [Klebsiella aerogenes]